MMKWLSLALSFLFGGGRSQPNLNFTEIGLEIYDKISARSRKPIALILCGVAAVIFVCGGIFIAMIDLARQYDLNGEIYFGAVFWSGIIMSAIFLAGYIYVFAHAWPGVQSNKAKEEFEEQMRERQPPGLDQAISLLIMDHIEERKEKRAHQEEEYRRTHRPGASSSHHSHDDRYPNEPTGFA